MKNFVSIQLEIPLSVKAISLGRGKFVTNSLMEHFVGKFNQQKVQFVGILFGWYAVKFVDKFF